MKRPVEPAPAPVAAPDEQRRDLVARAAEILAAGGVVAYPTETFYALGARLDRPEAVARVARLKGRAEVQPFPVLCADGAQAAKLCRDGRLPDGAVRLAARFWPGRLTLVVPARDGLPPAVAPAGEIGLRVSAHPFAAALCRAAGPLVGTSANRTGTPAAAQAAAVEAAFGAELDLIAGEDEGVEGGAPSTVVRPGAELEVLREGVLSEAEVRGALGDGPTDGPTDTQTG